MRDKFWSRFPFFAAFLYAAVAFVEFTHGYRVPGGLWCMAASLWLLCGLRNRDRLNGGRGGW